MTLKKRLLALAMLAILTTCGVNVFTACSPSDTDNAADNQQHYTYLNAAEERENVTKEQRAEYAPYAWRLECENETSMPRNWRTSMSEFVERDLLNGYDPDYEPSRKGLDQLKVSASSDFSALQLDTLVKEIRKLHSGPITIVDLRNETHGLINGYHVSIYGKQNWANIGLSRETILAEEADLIHNTVGQQLSTVVLDKANNYQSSDTIKFDVTTAETEAEACAKRGLGYVRLTVLDHCFTDPRSLDDFIAFVQQLPADTWLHFHCKAGKGQTTMYMVFYDFLRNPDVSEKDVIYRQYKLGGNFMYYQGDKPKEEAFKVPLAKEKAEMIPLVYKYIQENHPKGFRISWAQWKAQL